jgi:hypothetical protein
MSYLFSLEWTWAVGILALLLVLVYSVLKPETEAALAKGQTEEGTKKVYREEERARDNRGIHGDRLLSSGTPPCPAH